MKSKRIIVGVGLVAAIGVGYAYFTGVFPPKSGLEGTIGAAQRYQTGQIADKDVVLQDPELQALLQSDVFHKLQTDPEFRKGFQAIVNSKAFEEAAKTGIYSGLDKKVEAEFAAKRASIETARLNVVDAEKRTQVLEKKSLVDKKVTPDQILNAKNQVEQAKRDLADMQKAEQFAKNTNVETARLKVADAEKRAQEIEKKASVDKKVTVTDVQNAKNMVEQAKRDLAEIEKVEQSAKNTNIELDKVQMVMKSDLFQKLVADHGTTLNKLAISGQGLGRVKQAINLEVQKANQASETEKRAPAVGN